MATQPVTNIGGLTPRAPAAPPQPRTLAPTGRLHLAAPGTARAKLAAMGQSAPQGPKKAPSLASQIGGVFGGVIPGILHLGREALSDTADFVRVPYRSFVHRNDPLTIKQVDGKWVFGDKGIGADKAFPLAHELGHGMEDTAGRLAQLGPVEVRSVGGRPVHTYGDLSREGRIVSGVLGDLGNVSIVGGAAGKALGVAAAGAEGLGATRVAAGLSRAADVAEATSRLGGRAANAPIEAAGGVLKGGRSLWRNLGQAGKEAVLEQLPREGTLGSRVTMAATREGQLMRQMTREAMQDSQAAAAHMKENLAKDSGLLEHKGDQPTAVEAEVGLTRVASVAQANRLIGDTLGADKAIEITSGGRVVPGERMTPEGAALAAEYDAGTLPPEVKARIDRVTESALKRIEPVTENSLEGKGLINGPMDPAFLGHQPIDEQVLHQLGKHMEPKDLEALQEMRLELGQDKWGPSYDPAHPDPPADWQRLQRALEGTPEGDLLDQILLDPDVYPAKWREAMHITGKASEVVGERMAGSLASIAAGDARLLEAIRTRFRGLLTADEMNHIRESRAEGVPWAQLMREVPELETVLTAPSIHPLLTPDPPTTAPQFPRTPAQLLAAGIDEPTWLPTVPSREGLPESPQSVPTTTGVNSGVRGVSSEHHSATRGTGPYSLARLAEGLGRNISNAKFNETVLKYVRHSDIPDVNRILGPETIDALRAEAEHIVDAGSLRTLGDEERAKAVQKQFGNEVIAELGHRGYEVLHGNRAEPRVGDFDPRTPPKLEEIGPDSVVLPKGVKARMVQHRTGKDTNALIAANAKVNQVFKRNVLAFNLHWTLGDAISNTLMSWVSGAVSPLELARSMRAVKNLDPAVFEQMFNRPDFTATGLRHQAVSALDPLGLERKPARTTIGRGIRKVQDAQFKGNRVVNAIQREGYVLEKLERELKLKGLDSTAAMGTDAAKWAHPDVQKALSDAINNANETFGTLDEMSPFEQRVMTQIFPFWSWTRHITALALRTAVDNPARMLWTLRLGAIGMEMSPDDMPDFMRGSVANPFGGGRINLNWANPLYDVGSGGLFSAGSAMRSLSPMIKLGANLIGNRDLNRNANVITHRPGTDPSRIASAAYQGVSMLPFGRGALNLAPRMDVPGLGVGLGPVRRYGSGQAIIDKNTGQVAPSGSRLRMAANMFNAPLATDYVPIEPKTTKTRRRVGLKRVSNSRLRSTGLNG